jgi:hypothetical protein
MIGTLRSGTSQTQQEELKEHTTNIWHIPSGKVQVIILDSRQVIIYTGPYLKERN